MDPNGFAGGFINRCNATDLLLAPMLRWLTSTIRIVGLNDATRMLRQISSDHASVVFYHWTEDELSRLVVAAGGCGGLGRGVTYVADDTMGGRLGAALLEEVGYATLVIRRSAANSGIEDMRRLIKAAGNISISADGGGPYRIINPQLPKLMERRRAVGVPVCTKASKSIVGMNKPWPLWIPAVGATISLVIGPVVIAHAGIGTRQLARALADAHEKAQRLSAAWWD
jgi:hypothetical protein